MRAMNRSVDRISGLPDDILIHILSFVTTRQAIQMSLVSKRWRHLWTFIPSLHFCDLNFFECERDRRGKSTRFLDFIDEVLERKRENNNITKFYFSAYCLMYAEIVMEWILHAVEGKIVQELTIETTIFNGKIIELPRRLFTCRSLSMLKLDMGRKFDLDMSELKLPTTLCDLRLKSLHLKCVVFVDLSRLISYCPFLEELDLRSVHCDDLKIFARRLEKLTIYDCHVATFEVSAPSLLSFNFKNGEINICILNNLVSLVEADIKISYKDDHRRILEGVSNVSSLILTYSGIRRHELPADLPMFENLTYLKLDICFNNHAIEVMNYILKHSPNLKTLVIYNNRLQNKHKQEEQEECYRWIEKQQSDQFLLHLSKIKIKNFQSSPMQLEIQQELVKYLLRNSRSVKEITITYI